MYPDLQKEMSRILGKECEITVNAQGNSWLMLDDNSKIKEIATFVANYPGKCLTISPTYKEDKSMELVYHFDFFEGGVFCVQVAVPDKKIESITSILRSAHWPERELTETWEMTFEGLFDVRWNRFILADPAPKGVVYASLSETMNTNASDILWERIKANREASEAGGAENE
ncbi:MAG: NADH-quinone oxidoreductase subunit C [bacterium]